VWSRRKGFVKVAPMKGLGRLLILGLVGPVGALWAAPLMPNTVILGKVVQVMDGDTLRLSSGYTVRLLDINTPELPHEGRAGQPLAPEATAALKAMVLGQTVQVQVGARVYDAYDRVLGHVFLAKNVPNRWVNGGMVASGLAHVYTFPDNRVYGPELLALEDTARAQKVGLWARPEWQVRDAAVCCAERDIGHFVVVQGKVQRVARVNERTYLNFGTDWRTDFSVAIDRKQEKFFKSKGKKKPGEPAFNFNDYLGQTVRVRGIATPVNGTLIKITHPEQLQRITQ
jgi:endonuclease YncB( thermonuclease family)